MRDSLRPILAFAFLFFLPPGLVNADPQKLPDHFNEQSTRFQETDRRSKTANRALRVCDRFVRGWLRHADPDTGLIPEVISGDEGDEWWPKDAAADNVPFMVLTSAITNRTRYRVRMHHILDAVKQVTIRQGALSDAYSFSKEGFVHEKPALSRLIFNNSEYAKDGLMPITNLLGRTAWSERLIKVVDSLWAHSLVSTPYGKIPSKNDEINGEMMQVSSRLFWMTGDETYLDRAVRIADWYLLGDHHPTRDQHKLRLTDHGSELISGLSEVYFAVHHARPSKVKSYREPIHAMLDRVLEIGTNKHGMMHVEIDPVRGEVTDEQLIDTWGYNYNAFYTVYQLDDVDRYREAVLEVLGNLQTHYPTEQFRDSADYLADTLESAINLFNRERVESVRPWMDAMARRLMNAQREDGVIEGWHGDGNTARTLLMYALWKQQGVTLHPWRPDVRIGAARKDDRLYLSLTAGDAPWNGRIRFDRPRHRIIMNMPADYPRINQFPEWYTLERGEAFEFERVGAEGRLTEGTASAPTMNVRVGSGQTVYYVIDPSPE